MKNKKLYIVMIFLILLAGFTYFFGTVGNRTQKVLKAYVPCGMLVPFKELAKAYEFQHPKIRLQYTFDNTNVLVKLILHKDKRPDLFVSPGEKELSLLKEKGLIEEDSIKKFGRYKLILIAPAKSDRVTALADLLNASVKTIAIAHPDFNSVGAYAMESLKSLGYWDKIKNKILFTNTPIEALSLVSQAKADAGIHYNACPFETNSQKLPEGAIKKISEFPADSHPAIHNYIGILKDSANKKIAQDLLDFMFSKKGNKILSQYGLYQLEADKSASLEETQVIVEAYYPFNEEHLFIKDYLLSLETKYKGKIKVDCIDFRSDAGYTRWRKTSLNCAGIFINGKNKFKIETKGQIKEIEFIRTMDVFWTKEDLEAVIERELISLEKK